MSPKQINPRICTEQGHRKITLVGGETFLWTGTWQKRRGSKFWTTGYMPLLLRSSLSTPHHWTMFNGGEQPSPTASLANQHGLALPHSYTHTLFRFQYFANWSKQKLSRAPGSSIIALAATGWAHARHSQEPRRAFGISNQCQDFGVWKGSENWNRG